MLLPKFHLHGNNSICVLNPTSHHPSKQHYPNDASSLSSASYMDCNNNCQSNLDNHYNLDIVFPTMIPPLETPHGDSINSTLTSPTTTANTSLPNSLDSTDDSSMLDGILPHITHVLDLSPAHCIFPSFVGLIHHSHHNCICHPPSP